MIARHAAASPAIIQRLAPRAVGDPCREEEQEADRGYCARNTLEIIKKKKSMLTESQVTRNDGTRILGGKTTIEEFSVKKQQRCRLAHSKTTHPLESFIERLDS